MRRPSTPRTPTPLHDGYYHHQHHHQHHLAAAGISCSNSSYLPPPPHHAHRGVQQSSSPPLRVVFAPVSSPSSRFWTRHSASLGDLATDFGGCFAQRAAAAAAASYGAYGSETAGGSVGTSPTGYSASPHAASYYGSQVALVDARNNNNNNKTSATPNGGRNEANSW